MQLTEKFLATQRGVRLHAFACECIRLGIKLPKSKRKNSEFIHQ